jgi:hypothetical protein
MFFRAESATLVTDSACVKRAVTELLYPRLEPQSGTVSEVQQPKNSSQRENLTMLDYLFADQTPVPTLESFGVNLGEVVCFNSGM